MKNVLAFMSQKNNHAMLKATIILGLILSVLGAQLSYIVKSEYSDQIDETTATKDNYNAIFKYIINHLSEDNEIVHSRLSRHIQSNEYEEAEDILFELGSNLKIYEHPENTGLYYYAIGLYFMIKNESKDRVVAKEIFFLAYLQCNKVDESCSKILDAAPLSARKLFEFDKNEEREKYIINQNNKSAKDELPIEKLCRIFGTLTLCKASPSIKKVDQVSTHKQSGPVTQSNKNVSQSKIDTLANQDEPEDEFSFIPDYKPDETTKNNKQNNEISHRDYIKDKQERYDNLHNAIVSLFESNAHSNKINVKCYTIKPSRFGDQKTGLKIQLTGPEMIDNDVCPINFNTIKQLTDCLMEVLKRYEKITSTEFNRSNYSINISQPRLEKGNFYCKEQIEMELGLSANNIIILNKPKFSIDITSNNFYYPELDQLNEYKRQYKIKQQNKN